ncbi:MAG: AbiH family protein [Bacteroidales bacterium]
MNITYLIGNGFDINIGLATRYSQFYEWYMQEPSKHMLIQKLKNDIDQNYENWADLELKLGEYTQEFDNAEDFLLVYEDILDHLAKYIQNEEEKFHIAGDSQARKSFNDDLFYPERTLLRADNESITRFKKNWESSTSNVNLISFNYSDAIDRLLQKSDNIIGKKPNGFLIKMNRLEHIHGYHSNRMILGVNDIEQVANKAFRTNNNVVNALVKPTSNQIQKHLIDSDCINIINESNLICLFGLSIGDTDRFWWEQIGTWLEVDNRRLLIFFKNNEMIEPRKGYKRSVIEEKVKDTFLSQTKISDSNKTRCKERITVGVDTELFKLNVVSKEKSLVG